ncbi:MAG TPA: hypothetical protein GX708_23615 [Gallicola sp.]|nr:hypothetical protein [Gallicola sp.]
MANKIGSNDIAKYYVGSSEVDKIYLGSDLVYSKTPPIPAYQMLDTLATAKYYLAGAGANGYAVFAGGVGGGQNNQVEAYNMNSSGTKSTLSTLATAKHYLAGAGANGYAVFAGGYSGSYNNQVEAYNMNSSGTKSTLPTLSDSRGGLAGAGAYGYAVFAGGRTSSSSHSSKVEAYNMNSSGTKSTLSALATAKFYLAGAGANGYVVFAGGVGGAGGGTYYNQVEAYNMNSSGTKSTLSTLATKKHDLAGAGANGYVVFAGGAYYSSGTILNNQVEAYNMNSSGTKSTLSTLSDSKSYLAGAGANGYAVFAGGSDGGIVPSSLYNQVEAYNMNSSGTKSTLSNLLMSKCALAGAGANGYVVFAGGTTSAYGSTHYNHVEAYYPGT